MSQQELLSKVVEYFRLKIFEKHIENSISIHSKLKSYNINPILVRYLSTVLDGNYTPIGVAKALFYPRVLSTSITTSFGTQIQKMFVELEMASGSLIKGMDIEFDDKIDGRKKWCQLKSGPNTINSEDVNPLLKKFSDTIALARTNHIIATNNDFVVGVLYGSLDELSMHYKKIDQVHPVLIGKDFWHRITGYEGFYDALVSSLQSCIDELDTRDLVNQGVMILASEIASSDLFDFA